MALQVETILREVTNVPYVVEVLPGSVLGPHGLGDDWVASYGDIEVMEDGHFVISEMFSDRFLMVSPDGTEADWVGRGGEGPGEYSFVRFVRAEGRHLHVFDQVNARRTILDEQWEVVHSNPMFVQLQFDGVILGDSAYVVNGIAATPEQIGYVLHLFDAEGRAIRSFDELPGPYGVPDAPAVPIVRWLVEGGEEGVWSAHRQEYRIDLWDPWLGVRTQTLVRMADWFPPRSAEVSFGPDTPGNPVLFDVAVDANGWLWVAIAVASDQWSRCFTTPPGSGEAEYVEGCVLFDTLIEVLDPVVGCVLASTRIPVDLWRVWPGLGVSGEYDALGFPVLRSWQLRLFPANHQGGERC